MKKISALILSAVCVFSLCMTASVSAVQLKGGHGQAKNMYKYIAYAPGQPTLTAGQNGLNVEFTGIIGFPYPFINRADADQPNFYWYEKGNSYFGGGPTTYPILLVSGYTVLLTNTTDKMMTIKWSQSAVTIGDISGFPFLNGMNGNAVPNSSDIPDTIIPAHQSFKVNVQCWCQGATIQSRALRADGSLKGVLYIKVIDGDGNASRITAVSPNIILPPSAFAATKITAVNK